MEAMIPTVTPDGKFATGFAQNPGEMMPNGAIIIAEKVTRIADDGQRESVVLAISGGYSPYCTWRRCVRIETQYKSGAPSAILAARDFCEIGYYSKTIEEAVAEFKFRCTERV